MKNALLFLALLFSANLLLAQQRTPPVAKPRPADYEYLSAPDSTGKRIPLKMPDLKKTRGQNATLPYPIIFIHGLNSNSEIWDSTTDFMDANYGTTYGGRIDFCLNYDGDYNSANLDFYPTSGADLAFFTPTLIAGDIYYVNFDVGTDGSFDPSYFSIYNVESNQSAVVKQGLALSWAIYYVLQETGRDKVILMGHSMGGLAAREYLQNPNLWQLDGTSHVAKLVTTGTPHGGSNSSFPISFFGKLPDEESDAVRDLRRTYAESGDSGVYLYGGYESNNVINDFSIGYFENVDVNCDGVTGDNIIGLDEKPLYINLDYSCIIGECDGCIVDINSGDGIVNDVSANLNNCYAGLNANLFYYEASAVTEIHTDLPQQIIQNMQGLDEPDNPNLAYHIGFDTLYTGFTTLQATNNPDYPTDFDEYKFTLPINSNLTVNISNVSLPNLSVNLIDTTFSTVSNTDSNNGNSTISFSQTLKAGTYFLNIFGTEAAANYLIPYNFKLSYSNISTVVTATNENNFNSYNYPNPFKNTTTISFSLAQSNFVTIKVYNLFGQVVSTLANEEMASGEHKIDFDASNLPSSIYYYRIQSGEYADIKKIDLLR